MYSPLQICTVLGFTVVPFFAIVRHFEVDGGSHFKGLGWFDGSFSHVH